MRFGGTSILPGGRAIAPVGKAYKTGAGSFALAVNSKGTTVVTANRAVLTAVTRDKEGWHPNQFEGEEAGRRVVSAGVAFEDDNDVFVSEGETGRVLLVDSRSGKVKQTYNLSHSGDLAYDAASKRLFVLDPAKAQLAIIDTGSKRILSHAPVERLPLAIALAPAGKRVYVAGNGTNVVSVVDVSSPANPEVIKVIPTGKSPAGIFATADRVFVSNSLSDSVSIIDTSSNTVVGEIALRFKGLEHYRGLLPIGLHYDADSKWLLVACAGINAIAVIDVEKRAVLGLIPTAWFPTRVAVKGGTVWVTCAKGYGTGPTGSRNELGHRAPERAGALLSFALPDASELAKHSGTVFGANGFSPRPAAAAPLPDAIEHVVVIVKENRTYDEVLGDIETASNGPVAGLPILARLGKFGVVNNRQGEFQTRLGLRGISVTPNHHALAQRFAFSDNFYVDSEGDADGHRWIAGAYPNAVSLVKEHERGPVPPEELPEAGLLWDHLDRHGVSHRRFGSFDMNVSDQARATEIIKELDGKPLPRLTYIHLPNDHMAAPRPDDGYPFPASFVADNDYALGRIIEYFSNSPWWPKMAIFVTEDDTMGGIDHVDSHRTVLLAISPYVKRNYVSHVNASFPGLMKTALRLLKLPPLNLFDATAADLADCFQPAADLEPYKVQPVPPEVYEPK
jgi:YVTN family beta-propeller protein